MNIKSKLSGFIVGLGMAVGLVYAADLYVFSPGDPILSSEINANFSELEARISANESATVSSSGEKVSWGANTTYVTSDTWTSIVTVPAGKKYVLTDITMAIDSGAQTNCHALPMAMIKGSTIGFAAMPNLKPTHDGTSQTCTVGVQSTSLKTGVTLPPGEVLSFQITNVGYPFGTERDVFGGSLIFVSGYQVDVAP